MKATSSLAATLAMAVFMSAGIANAADFTWANAATANQDWFGSGNWSPTGVPNSDSDTAILSEIDTYASSRVLFQRENATVSVVRVDSATNIWQITVDDWWSGKLMVLKAASGNAVVEVKNFGGIDPGGYYGNLRISTGNGMLRFESDTDITVTNDSVSKAYLVTPLPLAGGATVNKYGNGQWTVENPDSAFSGTINVYNGTLVLGNNGNVLNSAAAVVAQTGGKINMGTQWQPTPTVYNTPVALNGGTMVNGSSDERQYKNVTVRSTGGVDPGWGKSTFNGVISGTGTFSQAGDGELRILNCAIKPGFSTGILNFNRTKGDFWFATNGAPVTLSIDVNGSGGVPVPGVNHDQVNVTGLQAGKDVDLANVNVVFSGTGGGAATNWFFTANLIVNGSELASVSNAPNLYSTIVYDYDGNRVGAIVTPEPTALLALAFGALLLGRRRRV